MQQEFGDLSQIFNRAIISIQFIHILTIDALAQRLTISKLQDVYNLYNTMPESKQKKINNLFDQWEILSVFVESTDEYLSQSYSRLYRKFYIQCILGILLAINGYYSHWGPWPWPQNYYFLIFSVIFYEVASRIYCYFNDIDKNVGTKVGEFIVDGYKTIYLFKVTPEKLQYILEEVDSETKEVKRKKSFGYLSYFTKEGLFLESKFLKHLEGFFKNKVK